MPSDFELLSEIDHGLWYATKKDDYRGAKYIAQLMGGFDHIMDEDPEDEARNAALALHDLMYLLNQGPAIAQIFNHENIISIAGHIQAQPVAGAKAAAQDKCLKWSKNYIVWDYCDAANLSALFQDQPYQNTQSYLPESLCWHVLTSLIRAVTYLHDGKRLFFDPDAECSEPQKWLSVDNDWNPILHRNIEPRNIFFQHPRGIETYGLCKLGNFERAVVTNHVLALEDGPDPVDEGEISIALSSRGEYEPLDISRSNLAEEPDNYTINTGQYTVADELWSIGSVIFTMMTGRQLLLFCTKYSCCHTSTCSRGGCLQDAASQQGCNCSNGGCEHIPTWKCTHAMYTLRRPRHAECNEPVINIDSYLTRAKYSWRLRTVVKDLLNYDPGNKRRIAEVLPFTKLVLAQYQEWKQGTKDGREYKDIDDDMMARWEAAKKMNMDDTDMS